VSSPIPPGPYGPRRSNTGLIVGIAIVAVVVLLGILGLILIVSGEDSGAVPTKPQTQPSQGAPSQGLPTEGQRTEPVPTTPTADPPRLTEATALTTKFLGYLNTNKQKEAAALGCAGSKNILPGVILLVVDESTNLKAGKATVEEPGTSAYPMRMDLITISGTANSNPATGSVRIEDVTGQPLCVRLFQVH
jgi:hypothetical protein